MSDKKLLLYQKIHEVMKDIEYLKKDDQVKFGQTNYKAISEEKVTMSVRQSLVKHGLIVVPIEQQHSKDGNLSTVDVKYQIIDIDSGESIVAVSSGTGADTQDKGVGKAMTYAYKYLFLRLFAIPTGEDPDKVSSAELDAKEKQAELITQKQIGLLKTKALQFAKARNQSVEAVYEVLKIRDITEIDKNYAEEAINKLDAWIEKAKQEPEQKGA